MQSNLSPNFCNFRQIMLAPSWLSLYQKWYNLGKHVSMEVDAKLEETLTCQSNFCHDNAFMRI